MKEFLKMTAATVVGFLIVTVISSFLSMVIFAAFIASASTSKPVKVQEGSLMKINLSGAVVERSESDEMEVLMRAMGENVSSVSLDDLRSAIDKAASADEIIGIYIECGALSASPASVQEIRGMLKEFREESGKPVYAYADNFTQGAYWAVADADAIWLNPHGVLSLSGITMQTMFFEKALSNLGIEMQVFKVGTFKSAVEPYTRNSMSDANREQMQLIADNIWAQMVSDAAGRPMQRTADGSGIATPARQALADGFVHGLLYRQDVEERLDSLTGRDVKFIGYRKFNRAVENVVTAANTVAVLYATGAIDGGQQGDMDSEKIVKELNRLADNDKVKAVVLRVNSPGGSAFGSEQMWYAAKRLREKKPLVVSMGDYAASGGYYMSCMADTIVAQPTTLTGSIGIFGMFPCAERLLDKIGVSFDGVKTAEHADFGLISRPVTESERAIMQKHINDGYELFVSRCAEGRGMTADEIKAIAEGRVWTGADALRLGLVDELGGLDRAIEIAGEMASLANYRVAEYPKKKDFMTQFMETLNSDIEARILSRRLGTSAVWYDALRRAQSMQGVQALMPYMIIAD